MRSMVSERVIDFNPRSLANLILPLLANSAHTGKLNGRVAGAIHVIWCTRTARRCNSLQQYD